MCALELFWVSLTVIFRVCVCVCVGDFFVYMWQCGFKCTGNFFPNSFSLCICIHISMYVCIYIYMCVCVCVSVCFQLDAFVREHIWHKV